MCKVLEKDSVLNKPSGNMAGDSVWWKDIPQNKNQTETNTPKKTNDSEPLIDKSYNNKKSSANIPDSNDEQESSASKDNVIRMENSNAVAQNKKQGGAFEFELYGYTSTKPMRYGEISITYKLIAEGEGINTFSDEENKKQLNIIKGEFGIGKVNGEVEKSIGLSFANSEMNLINFLDGKFKVNLEANLLNLEVTDKGIDASLFTAEGKFVAEYTREELKKSPFWDKAIDKLYEYGIKFQVELLIGFKLNDIDKINKFRKFQIDRKKQQHQIKEKEFKDKAFEAKNSKNKIRKKRNKLDNAITQDKNELKRLKKNPNPSEFQKQQIQNLQDKIDRQKVKYSELTEAFEKERSAMEDARKLSNEERKAAKKLTSELKNVEKDIAKSKSFGKRYKDIIKKFAEKIEHINERLLAKATVFIEKNLVKWVGKKIATRLIAFAAYAIPIIGEILMIVDAVMLIWEVGSLIWEYRQEIWTWIKDTTVNIIKSIPGAIEKIADYILHPLDLVKDIIKGLKKVWEWLKDLFNRKPGEGGSGSGKPVSGMSDTDKGTQKGGTEKSNTKEAGTTGTTGDTGSIGGTEGHNLKSTAIDTATTTTHPDSTVSSENIRIPVVPDTVKHNIKEPEKKHFSGKAEQSKTRLTDEKAKGFSNTHWTASIKYKGKEIIENVVFTGNYNNDSFTMAGFIFTSGLKGYHPLFNQTFIINDTLFAISEKTYINIIFSRDQK